MNFHNFTKQYFWGFYLKKYCADCGETLACLFILHSLFSSLIFTQKKKEQKLLLEVDQLMLRCNDTRDFRRKRNCIGMQRRSMDIPLYLPVVPISASPFCLFCDCIISSGIPSDADFSDWKGFLRSRHDSGSWNVNDTLV